jgi:hypothetical protein
VGLLELNSQAFDFESQLWAVLKEMGLDQSDLNGVDTNQTIENKVAFTNVLVGGRTSGKGDGALCVWDQSSGWSCGLVNANGAQPSTQDFQGAALNTRTLKCTVSGCVPDTVPGDAWLMSSSPEGSLDAYYDFEADADFDLVGSKEGLGPNYRGSLSQGEFVWHYGSGLLRRCLEGECIDFGVSNKLIVIDAMAYGDGVVFLTNSTFFGYQFAYFEAGASPTLESLVYSPIKVMDGEVYTAISGTSTIGIYILGHDVEETHPVIQRFLK